MRHYLLAGLAGALIIAIVLATRLGDDERPTGGDVVTTAGSALPRVRDDCGSVSTHDTTGHPVSDAFLDKVRAVHATACHGPPEGLVPLMDDGFDPGPDAYLRLVQHSPQIQADLTEVLESEPTTSQGGLTYCIPGKGMAIFARGTLTRPGGWSAFDPKATHC
jgi:hypothetical protein